MVSKRQKQLITTTTLVRSNGDLPTRTVRSSAQGLMIVAAETRRGSVLMCLIMSAKRESGHEDTVRQRCVGWHCGLGRFTRQRDKGCGVDRVGRRKEGGRVN